MADSRTGARGEAFVPIPVYRHQNISGTAVALSGVTEADLQNHKANLVWITCRTAAILYRWDGTSPTTTDGHPLPVDTPLRINGRKKILAFRMIGDAGAAASVQFTLEHSASAGGIQ